MNMQRRWAAAMAIVLASPAIAGEVTGNDTITPIKSRGVASSACAFSGLNDDGLGPSSTIQAYGMFVRAFGQSLPGPGTGCRGNL